MATKVTKLFRPEVGTVHWLNECIERGKREVFSEVIQMTPGLAGVLLQSNPDNRCLKPHKLGHFVADMIADRWTLNGQPIIVSKDGLLNDGQHRLTALREANLTLPMVVTFGLDRETRTTLDQGTARTAGDFLHMDGGAYANQCASIARIVLAYEKGCGRHMRDVTKLTNAEIVARVRTDPGILKAAEYATHVQKYTQKFAAPAIIGTAFYLLSEIHPADAKEYMDAVAIGEGLRLHDPAHTVRNALLSFGKGSRQPKIEMILHGWNKFRARAKLKLVRSNGIFPALV
jgi:hypothetical protein